MIGDSVAILIDDTSGIKPKDAFDYKKITIQDWKDDMESSE